MTSQLVVTLSFVAAVLTVAGVGSLATDVFFRNRRRIRSRLSGNFGLGDQLGDQPAGPASQGALFKDFSQLASELAPALPGFRTRFQDLLVQSGLRVTGERFLAASAAMGLLVAAAGAWLSLPWWLGSAAAGMVSSLPLVYLRARCRRRQDKLCRQLPEAFELMARAVRAGQSMTAAFQIVAHDLEPPISEEFARCYEQQNLGRSPDLALRDMARRTGVMELQMFVVALLVQRQSGGNVVELLNNLSGVVRKRIRLKGKVQAMTGEGRLQALVLTVLPIAVFLALLFLNRPYVQVLLNRPSVLGAVLACQALGTLWIHRIVNVDY